MFDTCLLLLFFSIDFSLFVSIFVFSSYFLFGFFFLFFSHYRLKHENFRMEQDEKRGWKFEMFDLSTFLVFYFFLWDEYWCFFQIYIHSARFQSIFSIPHFSIFLTFFIFFLRTFFSLSPANSKLYNFFFQLLVEWNFKMNSLLMHICWGGEKWSSNW